MGKQHKTPKFPDSYIGEEAYNYDNLNSMERNQKKTAIKCIQYLFDENLGDRNEVKVPSLLLDLGCGTGFSSEILLQNDFKVVGIDILLDMISKAKNKKNKLFELVQADINHLPFRNYSFDHGISVSAYNFIIHNTPNEREVRKVLNNTAKELKNVLKGRIIIEFYPENDAQLNLFIKSFTQNGFDGFMIKNNPKQKAGQTFLLMKKE